MTSKKLLLITNGSYDVWDIDHADEAEEALNDWAWLAVESFLNLGYKIEEVEEPQSDFYEYNGVYNLKELSKKDKKQLDKVLANVVATINEAEKEKEAAIAEEVIDEELVVQFCQSTQVSSEAKLRILAALLGEMK